MKNIDLAMSKSFIMGATAVRNVQRTYTLVGLTTSTGSTSSFKIRRYIFVLDMICGRYAKKTYDRISI